MHRPLRTLLVAPVSAAEPWTGAGQRTELVRRALTQLGEVDLLLVGSGDREHFERLFPASEVTLARPRTRAEWGAWALPRRMLGSRLDVIATMAGKRRVEYRVDPLVHGPLVELIARRSYDVAFGRYLRPTAKSGVRSLLPVVLDLDDLDTEVLSSRLARARHGPGRAVIGWHLRQMQELMPELLRGYAALLVTKSNDLAALPGDGRVLPNLPFAMAGEIPEPLAPAIGSRVVLFVGSAGHRPNVTGIVAFVREGWERVLARHPSATLRLVGTGDWSSVARCSQRPGIEVVGCVDDVTREYQRAALVLCPVREGGGTKIKVLEALLYGRAVVAAPESCEGYDERLRRVLLTGGDPGELGQRCGELLEQPQRAADLASAGRRALLESHSFERFAAVVHEAVREVLRRPECAPLGRHRSSRRERPRGGGPSASRGKPGQRAMMPKH